MMKSSTLSVAASDESGLASIERTDLRQRLLKRGPQSVGSEPIDMTVFERLPDLLLYQQAEFGVEAAKKELARRRMSPPLNS